MKFVMNKSTKNQKLNISHLVHKATILGYFTFSLNDYILCEICYEQRHKESEITY